MPMKALEPMLNEFSEYHAYKVIMLYGPPVIIALGTFGNAFSFIILRRRAMVKVSSYHYLATLAVTDSLVLYIGLLRIWLAELTGFNFYLVSDLVCKLTIAFGYMASHLSVWLIIAVTVERYIVVCFPLRASSFINPHRAKRVILFLMALMFCINLHFFWTVELVTWNFDDQNVTTCESAPQYAFFKDVWNWVDACIYSFVPFVIILVLNILIVHEVIQARAHRLRMQNNSEHYHYHHHHQMFRLRYQPHYNFSGGGAACNNNNSLHNGAGGLTYHSSSPRELTTCRRICGPGEGMKLTFMLLTVSFAFLLTTLPMNIMLIITVFWQRGQHGTRSSLQFKLASTVAELLMYANHSMNFGLYCATGQKFRQQIVYLLRCRRDNYAAWSSLHTDDSNNTKFHNSSLRNGNGHTSVRLLANVGPDGNNLFCGDPNLPRATSL